MRWTIDNECARRFAAWMRLLAGVGVAVLVGSSCAEGQDLTSVGETSMGGSNANGTGGAHGTGGTSGTGGSAGSQGGTTQSGGGTNAQGGSAQGGSGGTGAQGGNAQGGSAQGGNGQGGMAPTSDASLDVGAGGAGPRDANIDVAQGGGTPLSDAVADRTTADARIDATPDVRADGNPTSVDGAVCSTGSTCSQCAEQRCPAMACALCQDTNHVTCSDGCTAILNCVIQHDGCATTGDPICFNTGCASVINAQSGGSPVRDWTSSLIRCSCF